MKEIILGVWIGVQAGFDFRYKEIPIWFSAIGAVIGIGFCVVEKRECLSLLLACLPGFMAFVFSWVTKESLGYGDGIVLLIMGIYLPISRLISIGMQAFLIAGMTALVLLVVFRKNGKYRMPFVPFLGIAYGCDWLIRMGGM